MTNRAAPGEVYIEFVKVGAQVKATAIDAETGLEVSVFGPAFAARSDLQQLVLAKLKRQKDKR